MGAYSTVYDTNSPVNSFASQVYSYTAPSQFPGRFQVCAITQSQKPSYVRLRVT